MFQYKFWFSFEITIKENDILYNKASRQARSKACEEGRKKERAKGKRASERTNERSSEPEKEREREKEREEACTNESKEKKSSACGGKEA